MKRLTHLSLAALALVVLVAAASTTSAQNATDGAIANAATVHSRISVGTTEDETQIKGIPGAVYSITATNVNAAVRYLKCYNLPASSAAPGTSTPWLRLAVPGAGSVTATFPSGAFFSVSLTCALVIGVADSDVAEVAANELIWTITYK